MPSPRRRLLVALCAVLAVVALAEMAIPIAGDQRGATPQALAQVESSLAALNRVRTPLPTLDALAETRSRPVFIATRREASAGTRIGGAQRDGLILGRYRLTGVVITPTRRSVVVKQVRGGKATELRVGSKIDGWRVEEIAPEFMKLSSGALTETISLVSKRRK